MLVVAFALASVVNLIYVAIRATRYFRYVREAPLWSSEMGSLFKLMLPVLLGNAVLEVNSIAEKAVASALGLGSVSALTYGWSVYEIVTGVIISALATVLFSYFAGYLAKDDVHGMTRCLEKCVTVLTLVLVPVTVVTVLCADDIVSVLSLVVSTYALGFVPTAMRSVLTKAHYAFQDSKTPMVNGAVTIVTGVVGAIVLALFCGMGIAGIGVAVSVSMVVSAALYQHSIAKKLPECRLDGRKLAFAAKCAVSGASSLAAGALTKWIISSCGLPGNLLPALASLAGVCLVCFTVFLLVARLLRVRELSYLFAAIPGLSRRGKGV